jgi:teichuronic acid exporter
VSLGEALRINTIWVLTGDVGARAVHLLFGVVLARLLMPEDFGLLVTVQILTGALGFLAAHGMSDALVRAREIGERDVRTVFAAQVVACLAIVALLNAIAPAFAAWFGDPRLAPLMRVASLTFLLRPFMSVPNALLQRANRFKEFSLLIFVGLIVAGAASTVLALLGLGPWSLLLGGLVGALTRTVLVARVAHWRPALAFDRSAARTHGVYGLKLSVNEIVQYLRSQTANALVSRQLGAGPVGLYNKGDSLAEIPFEMLSGSAYHTLFRTLASIQDDRARCGHLFLRSVALVSFYALPCYVGLVWVAEPLVVALYGAPWAGAAMPLQILAAAGLLRVVANLSRAVAAAHNRLGREIAIQVETWAVLLLGTLIGLHWGLAGVALGTLPSFLYNAARMYALARAILVLGWGDLWRTLRPVVALNALLAAVLALAHLGLATSGLVQHPLAYLAGMAAAGSLVYGGVFLLRPPVSLHSESQRWRTLIRDLLRRARGAVRPPSA